MKEIVNLKSRTNASKDNSTLLNITRIETDFSKVDEFTKIKHSFLGKIYQNYCKPLPAVRRLVIFGWRVLYPLSIQVKRSLLRSTKSRKFKLVGLNEYMEKNKCQFSTYSLDTYIDTPVPRVFPERKRSNLFDPTRKRRFNCPPTFKTRIPNATVVGGTNITFVQSDAIHHDLYDFRLDYTSEELHQRHTLRIKNRSLIINKYDSDPYRLSCGASFLDACSHNYAHWITEVLSRIVVFCSSSDAYNIPLLVDDGLHDNIIDSIFHVAGPDRQVILVPQGKSVLVDDLYLTSVCGYVPFERRQRKTPSSSEGIFSPLSFSLLVQNLIPKISHGNIERYPDRIYIKRNSKIRSLVNASEIENSLIANGYFVFEPERYTFLEQVAFFNQAKVIVGGSGAAMANLIFCDEKAVIKIMISEDPETSYWYWQNIACASGKEIQYILGRRVGTARGVHADFYLDPRLLV